MAKNRLPRLESGADLTERVPCEVFLDFLKILIALSFFINRGDPNVSEVIRPWSERIYLVLRRHVAEGGIVLDIHRKLLTDLPFRQEVFYLMSIDLAAARQSTLGFHDI